MISFEITPKMQNYLIFKSILSKENASQSNLN